MENSSGFTKLINETKSMELNQYVEWMKQLTLDELDDIVHATEYIAKIAVKEMGNRNA